MSLVHLHNSKKRLGKRPCLCYASESFPLLKFKKESWQGILPVLSYPSQSCVMCKASWLELLACAIMAELTLNEFKLGWRSAAHRRTPAKHVAAIPACSTEAQS